MHLMQENVDKNKTPLNKYSLFLHFSLFNTGKTQREREREREKGNESERDKEQRQMNR